MKIVCDKCGAKYSIADEKVRGKTFKIRCKKCSNVIIVRDKAGAEAEAGGDAGEAPADDPAAAAAAAAAPGWHLAVGGETVGPVPEEDVRARYDRGEIDKETAVWQEGFEDWVPLADVPLFADLPDQPAAAGAAAAGAAAAGGLAAGLGASAGSDDPFGSGGDDAFAGGGDDAFGSSPEPAAATAPAAAAPAASAPAAEEPQSPRVANLTGARNENSVLFSLDNLQAMAAGSGSSTPAPKGPAKVATSAPTSEGSGLIDIRAMGSLMGGGADGSGGPDIGGGGGASDDGGAAPLPSFGGGGFGGLSAQPLVTTPPEEEATPAAPPPPPKSNTGLYIVVGVLALGLIGLGAFILTRPTPEPQKETVVVKEQVLVPTVSDSDKDDDKDEDEDKDEDKDEEADTDGADTDGTEDEVGADGKPTGKKKKKKKKSGSTTSSTTGGSDPAPAKEEPKKPTNSADDVDCLLDPSLPKCKGGGGSTKKPSGGGGGSVPANAPEKLGPSDLSAGISPVKAAASGCKSKGGVPPGTKVPIKLSIKGSTGKVISASAQGDYAKTAAATCAAKELKKATFKKFKATQMGFTYKVKM